MRQIEDKQRFLRARAGLGSLRGGHPAPWPPPQGLAVGWVLPAHVARFRFLGVKRCCPTVFFFPHPPLKPGVDAQI